MRIGQGLAASGELGARPMERALYTLDVFAQFCRASGLQDGAIDITVVLTHNPSFRLKPMPRWLGRLAYAEFRKINEAARAEVLHERKAAPLAERHEFF